MVFKNIEREGLGEYRAQLNRQNSQVSGLSTNTRNSVNKSIMSLESLISNKMLASGSQAGSNNSYRNTLQSQNAQSILYSRNNSMVSASQVNGLLSTGGQSIHSLKSANGTQSNNQISAAQSVQSLKNSSLVSNLIYVINEL